MSVQLKPDKPISLNVRLIVDLTEVVGPWEYFVVLSDLELLKKEDPTSSSLVINKNIEPNVIFRHLKSLSQEVQKMFINIFELRVSK